MAAAGQISYNEASQGKKVGLYFKGQGKPLECLKLRCDEIRRGFLKYHFGAVRRVDVRVTRVGVESADRWRDADGGGHG